MADSEAGAAPEFSAEERELIKDLVFDGQSVDIQRRKAWLDAQNPPEQVRLEVERLWRSADTCSPGFLQQPATDYCLGTSRELPTQIGRYRVIGEIGTGGVGVVYAAEDANLKRQVAIKVLAARTADDPEMQERLRWEAKKASSLQHPNIVTVHEVGFDGRSDYVVMEYIAGQPLNAMIPKHGMNTVEALGYAIQIASGLEAAHAAGIVHRDVKPGNIMVAGNGVVKLLDFGLAKDLWTQSAPGDAPPTVQGKFAGTPAYASPEQAEGRKVDVRSDIFSFGSVLYEMLTGRRAILREDSTGPIELHPKIEPVLDDIVCRCLRKDRSRRFQSIAEVGVRLQEIKEEIEHPKETPPRTSPGISKRSWPWLAGSATVGAVAAIAWALLFLERDAGTDRLLFNRLTSDIGVTQSPALSRDGRLLAYASDRAGSGNLNIWVQQLNGSEPRPITQGPDNYDEPVFSPDASKLAYRSSRDGGGIFLAPALGGSETKIAPKGRGPQFSPDSKSIAYWTGEIGASLNPGSLQVYIASLRYGTAPQRFRPDFVAAAYPFWSPRGDRLLFLGRRQGEDSRDWWVASIDGTYARSTHLVKSIQNAGLHKRQGTYWLTPAAWLPSGKVLFSATTGDATNIWSVDLDNDGVTSGLPHRLTFGTTIDLHPSATESGGKLELAFAAQTVHTDVWQMALNAAGLTSGAPKRLIFGMDSINSPSIGWDGSLVAFATRVPDGQAIRLFASSDGKIETATALRTAIVARPLLSGNGEFLAYSDSKKGYIRNIATGQSEAICEKCAAPTHVSVDGREVLFEDLDSADQMQICSNRTPCRPMIPWAGKPFLRQSGARFSPDARWIVFAGGPFETSVKHIWITPVRTNGTIAESDLIQVTRGDAADIEPYWSPDGKTLYFLSNRDGFRCIFGQRVDPVTAKPAGVPFAVFHSHQAYQPIQSASGYSGDIGLSVARDSLVLTMTDRRSNIWFRKEPPRKR